MSPHSSNKHFNRLFNTEDMQNYHLDADVFIFAPYVNFVGLTLAEQY